MSEGRVSRTDFDEYASNYEAALERGLSVSGADRAFFAEGRIAWLARCLRQINYRPSIALDFGCGSGSSAPLLADLLGAVSVVGVDVSERTIERATMLYGSDRITFRPLGGFQPSGELELVYSNGVFHHIPPAERAGVVSLIHRSLRPGGIFALWENNPWNPGTRYVMSRIPFDRDAITLTAPESRDLLRSGGFEILRTDFLFIFPSQLGFLRGLEPFVSSLPLGAQYQVLVRKDQHVASPHK